MEINGAHSASFHYLHNIMGKTNIFSKVAVFITCWVLIAIYSDASE